MTVVQPRPDVTRSKVPNAAFFFANEYSQPGRDVRGLFYECLFMQCESGLFETPLQTSRQTLGFLNRCIIRMCAGPLVY